MNALVYLVSHKLKNRVKEIFHRPAELLLLLVGVALVVFVIFAGNLGDGSVPRDRAELSAIIFLLYALVFVLTAKNGFVNGASMFSMADVNLRALELSRENAKRNCAEVRCLESNGMEALKGEQFDMVITNPPIRAGKQVIYRMFADAAECLRPGGSLILVIRKQQGAESCIRYLQTLFPEVEKTAKSGGFWVLKATKNEPTLS